MIWYSSHEQDTLGRLDPKTGEVTEYPYPHSEISMREFFVDSKGRMWYASSVNNKIGYFYFNDASTAPQNRVKCASTVTTAGAALLHAGRP